MPHRHTKASVLRNGSVMLAVVSVLALSACKKDPVAPPKIATGNVVAPLTPAVASAIAGRAFSFPGAAAILAPAAAGQNLAISFGGTSAAVTSAATITNASGATTGGFTANVTFGSCTFTITSLTGTTGLTNGQVIRVNPCTLNLSTAGQPATGQSQNTNATLVFGTNTSAPVQVQVAVSETGQVTVNGTPVGNVPTGNATP